jgi:hypothetical protein
MVIKCGYLPHQGQLSYTVTTSNAVLAMQSVTSEMPTSPEEFSVLCAKILKIDFHRSSHFCLSLLPIREGVSNVA